MQNICSSIIILAVSGWKYMFYMSEHFKILACHKYFIIFYTGLNFALQSIFPLQWSTLFVALVSKWLSFKSRTALYFPEVMFLFFLNCHIFFICLFPDILTASCRQTVDSKDSTPTAADVDWSMIVVCAAIVCVNGSLLVDADIR